MFTRTGGRLLPCFLPHVFPACCLPRKVVVVDATRCHRLVLQKEGVGRFVVSHRLHAPRLRPGTQTGGLRARAVVPVRRYRSDDVGSVLSPAFLNTKLSLLPNVSVTAFEICVPGVGGTVASTDRAAAEWDVAGLGSEATATFGVEWLKPLLPHSHSNESSIAKICLSVKSPGQATLTVLRGVCRASLADNVRGRGEARAWPMTTRWPRARSS